MAKGNLFQGMGRGKVGDVVFSRLNGQQISRVRNRNPKNPRTNAQLYQRAVMATVMQAYAAGKAIFDHSFQGKEVGSQNQRRFMQLNAKALRAGIATYISGPGVNVPVSSQSWRCIAPGIPSAVPNKYVISEGALVNTLLEPGNMPVKNEGEKLSNYCARLGLNPNDLYTFVAFYSPDGATTLFTVAGVDDDEHNYHKQIATSFVWARYKVKESAFTSESTTFAFGDILELTDSNFAPLATADAIALGMPCRIKSIVDAEGSGFYGWIRSRENEGLRSSSTMINDGTDAGIVAKYVLQAWKQGSAALGDSDLILEGGDL